MSEKSKAFLQDRVEQLRSQIRKINDPMVIANKTGFQFREEPSGLFLEFSLFNEKVNISFPELVVRNAFSKEDMPVSAQAMICYHILSADGSALANRWISFAELPDGLFYHKAFQNYTGDQVSNLFGNDIDLFCRSNGKLCGESLSYRDAGFRYLALPRVPMAIIYNLGDDEFPSSCKLLFDASVCHYLPTDVCAILGSMLANKIIQVGSKNETK